MRKKVDSSTSNLLMWIILLSVSLALVIVSFIQSFYLHNYVDEQKELFGKMYFSLQDEAEGEKQTIAIDDYLSSYYELNQKTTETINTIIAFVGCIFAITTIVNAIISLNLPKTYDKKLKEIKAYGEETKAYAELVGIRDKDVSVREKILMVTELIERSGDTTGEIYSYRAELYEKAEEYSNAVADYKYAHKHGFSTYLYYHKVAKVYSEHLSSLGDLAGENEIKRLFEQAKDFYERAMKVKGISEKERSDSLCNIGNLYQTYKEVSERRLGAEIDENDTRTKTALSFFERSIAAYENNANAYFNRGVIYKCMGEEYYEKAYEDFQTSHNLSPDNKKSIYAVINTAIQLGLMKKELHYYIEAKMYFDLLYKGSEYEFIDYFKDKLDVLKKEVKLEETAAQVSSNMGDMDVEEANKYEVGTSEYSSHIESAISNYDEALEIYQNLYLSTHDEIYKQKYKIVLDKKNALIT